MKRCTGYLLAGAAVAAGLAVAVHYPPLSFIYQAWNEGPNGPHRLRSGTVPTPSPVPVLGGV